MKIKLCNRLAVTYLSLLSLLSFGTSDTYAQSDFTIGPEIGYTFSPNEVMSNPSIGFRANFLPYEYSGLGLEVNYVIPQAKSSVVYAPSKTIFGDVLQLPTEFRHQGLRISSYWKTYYAGGAYDDGLGWYIMYGFGYFLYNGEEVILQSYDTVDYAAPDRFQNGRLDQYKFGEIVGHVGMGFDYPIESDVIYTNLELKVPLSIIGIQTAPFGYEIFMNIQLGYRFSFES